MKKADLVAKMAEGADITRKQAELALNCFVSSVTEALKAEEKVTLVGFGSFLAVTRKARIGRNPQTGEPLKIAEKTSGKFSPGKSLKDLKPKPKPKPKAAAKKKK